MKFGAMAWNNRSGNPRLMVEELRATAHLAEATGYDSLWVSDHPMPARKLESKYPYSRTGEFQLRQFIDPLLTLAMLGEHTNRIKLGTNIILLPLRHPLMLAKMISGLDVLTNGRLIIGAGAGWMKEEFDFLGAASFEHRGTVMDEYLQIFKEVWTKEHPQHKGKYYQFDNLHFEPKPLQGTVPVLIGGNSEAALRRAVRYADGWLGLTMPFTDYLKYRDRLKALCIEYGRDFSTLTVGIAQSCVIDLNAKRDPEAEKNVALSGHPETIAARIRKYQAEGLQHLGVFHGMVGVQPGPKAHMTAIETFAKEVLTRV